MVKIEQRKETRILAKHLPKKYQTFSVSLDTGKNIIVTCVEASLNGFSFFSELSSDSFLPGTEICLKLEGIDHPISGIILSSDETKYGIRKGVSFQASEGYNEYKTIFHIIVNNLSIEKNKNSKKSDIPKNV